MNNEEREVEIDLLQLVRVLLKNVKYILIATVILGLLGFIGSSLFLTPIYQASAKMIVNTRSESTQTVTNDQINSAKNLVNTYAIIITSRDVLNQIIDDLNLTENYNQLKSCISVNAVNSTQVMEVVVQHKNVETAQAVAAEILKIVPSVIVETVEAGSVKPVEQAYANPNPVSPNILKNAVLMAAVGFILSCAVIIVIFIADNTYKSELDIQNDLKLPVLGVIPTIESCNNNSGYGQSAKSARGRK